METPLTPLEFMRRARRLFGSCEAVVDGSKRFTYEQLFDRCDRWSAVLQRLGSGTAPVAGIAEGDGRRRRYRHSKPIGYCCEAEKAASVHVEI